MARLVVLEWDRPAAEIAAYLAMLHEETYYDCQFCWSDLMVPPFGLIDEQGHPKPEYFSYVAACGGQMSAIDERAAQLGEAVLGAPLGEEVEVNAYVRMRPFYNAVLVDILGAGVYALAEATVASKFRPAPV